MSKVGKRAFAYEGEITAVLYNGLCDLRILSGGRQLEGKDIIRRYIMNGQHDAFQRQSFKIVLSP